MSALERFLGDLENPSDRVTRGGRIASLAFITGGLIAIPANFLIDPDNWLIYLMPLLSLGPGIALLFIRWDKTPLWVVHATAVTAAILVSFSMAVASPFYATFYVFSALFVAMVFRKLSTVMIHLSLISVGLFVPVLVGNFTGRETLILALLEAPSLFVVGTLTSYLQSRLEDSREAYWTLSRQDALTGVGNYRALHEHLAQEIARHRRHDRSFALILVDLDGFKQVNEILGHLEGDRVLSLVGGALREAVRGEDSVFRQGGDEFSVIAPETSVEEVDELAERLREHIAACAGDDPPVTASTGWAIFPAHATNADDLLASADLELPSRKRLPRRS